MSADKDRGIRRQKQKRAKAVKKDAKKAGRRTDAPAGAAKPAEATAA